MARRPAAGDATDIFMQFKDLSVSLDGAQSHTLVEQKFATGLSIRGRLVWLIHMLEITMDIAPSATVRGYMSLSTIPGLPLLPTLGDRGLVAAATNLYSGAAASGWGIVKQPMQLRYFPPIPLAAPELVLYAKTSIDTAAARDADIWCRVGFTTTELTNALVLELAEVWGW